MPKIGGAPHSSLLRRRYSRSQVFISFFLSSFPFCFFAVSLIHFFRWFSHSLLHIRDFLFLSFLLIPLTFRTIGNIVTGDEFQTQEVINASALPSLHGLLSYPRKAVRKEACWAISNITAGTVAQIEAVLASGIMPRLIQNLKFADYEIRREAAWAISNATSSGTHDQIKRIVDVPLRPLPQHPSLTLVDRPDPCGPRCPQSSRSCPDSRRPWHH